MHLARAATLLACVLGLAGRVDAQLTPPLELDLDTVFPATGGVVQVTVTGPPGAFFGVQFSLTPTELSLGSQGTVYINPAAMFPAGAGVLDGTGTGGFPIPIPAGAQFEDAVIHLQAGALDAGGMIGFSNSATLRIGATVPNGKRNPESVAVTPDGALAYVAHKEDASVSVIDLATHTVVRDVALGPAPLSTGFPVRVAIDPEGRHVYVVHPGSDELAVLDAANGSVVARLDVPRATRDVAFDFSLPFKTIYLTSERQHELLRFLEIADGVFAPETPVPLSGRGPGPMAVHPDGRVIVGLRTDHAIEVVDPALPPFASTLATYSMNRLPYDVELVGEEVWIPTFDVSVPGDGRNELRRLDLATGALLGTHLHDVGTDYVDVAIDGARVAVVGAGSGSVVHADAVTLKATDVTDLAPFQPLATPQAAAFVPGADELLVVNYFRDSLAVIDLAAPGAPVRTEIAMHLSGSVQVALVHLSQEDDGDWWFRSVQFFNGTPQTPNPVTCATCHPFGAGSDGILHPGRQAMPMFDAGATGPYGSGGFQPVLLNSIQGTFGAHGTLGGTIPFEADLDIEAYLTNDAPPPASPHLLADGSLTPDAAAGKAIFEGAAGCSACHAAPLFIPAGAQKTVPGGVGTGLSPANVPSLRGAWATAPYLHDHAAADLIDVLTTQNPFDQHGTTSGLTPTELDQLVAYLLTL